MKGYITITILILILCNSILAQENTNDIVWQSGIAFRSGKAIYFDPSEYPTILGISIDYLTNQKKYYPVFPGGYLFWDCENEKLLYYSVPVKNTFDYVIESKKIIDYKISNEAIYLKDTNTGWEKMEFSLIKENPDPDTFYRVYLKSRWFEGEYDISKP